MTTARRIVATLVQRTRQRKVRRSQLAAILGVNISTISQWRYHRLPTVARAAAWAEYVGLRLVVFDQDGQVLVEGADIPCHLKLLRNRAGLSLRQVAERAHTRRSTIFQRETRTVEMGLGTAAEHLTLLGYRLGLAERPLREAA
ncbi:hypothetical protein [Microbispora sp. CA-102843]|uniref:hypothetical protein n=1 Tax=Microbispora sp. CA-102843 TaxID=3239952 RepID=UPI003D903C35